MSPLPIGGTTITIVKMAEDSRDDRNNPVLAATGDEYVIPGCRFDLQTSDELVAVGEDVVDTWLAILPNPTEIDENATISAIDLLRVAGADYEIDGEPDYPDHIDGTHHHLEVVVKRVGT